ncbi:MAG: hypothetical protein ACSHXB_16375 [Sulfitobacter sp.]
MTKRILVGPSHIVRWQKNIDRGAAPSVGDQPVFFGFGGAPIWSKSIWEQVAGAYEAGETEIILLVGDTRFGNQICAETNLSEADYPFADGYLAIERDQISKACDEKMAARVEAAIDAYLEAYGDAVRVLYWDAIGRRALDCIAGRNIGPSGYDHPSWGTEFPGARRPKAVVSLQDIFSYPMGEACRIYLDDSIHPSTIGYHFLSNIIVSKSSVPAAFDRARKDVMEMLVKEILRLSGGRKILIAGNSIWIDVLRRLIGGRGVDELAEHNIHVKSTGASSSRDHISTADFGSYEEYLFVSWEHDLGAFLKNNQRLKETPEIADETVFPFYISWEGALSLLYRGKEMATNRPVPHDFTEADYAGQWGKAYKPESVREIIEIGLRGEPTFLGISAIFDAICEDDSGH